MAYLRALIQIALILFLSLLDIAFVAQLPFGLQHLHLLPVALIFVFLLSNIRLAAWWAIGGGLVLECFSFENFGWLLLAALLVLFVIYLLFEKVITNRSLYSVCAVTAAAVVTFDATILFRDYLNNSLNPIFWTSVLGQLIGIAYAIVTALIVFYISNAFSHRLHPAFLSKRSL